MKTKQKCFSMSNILWSISVGALKFKHFENRKDLACLLDMIDTHYTHYIDRDIIFLRFILSSLTFHCRLLYTHHIFFSSKVYTA